MVEDPAPAELESEVDVAHLDAEQRADQHVVHERVDRAEVALAGAVEAVGADDVDVVVAQQAHGPWQLGHVERQIGVGVEHEVTGRRRRTRSSSRRRACGCARGGRRGRAGSVGGDPIGDRAGGVGRRVVDDDQLVVGDLAAPDQAFAGRAGRRRGRARCTPPRSTSDRRSTASANGTIGARRSPAVIWGTVREGIRRPGHAAAAAARRRTVMSVTDAEPIVEPVGESLAPAGGRLPPTCSSRAICRRRGGSSIGRDVGTGRVRLLGVWKTSVELGLGDLVARRRGPTRSRSFVRR